MYQITLAENGHVFRGHGVVGVDVDYGEPCMHNHVDNTGRSLRRLRRGNYCVVCERLWNGRMPNEVKRKVSPLPDGVKGAIIAHSPARPKSVQAWYDRIGDAVRYEMAYKLGIDRIAMHLECSEEEVLRMLNTTYATARRWMLYNVGRTTLTNDSSEVARDISRIQRYNLIRQLYNVATPICVIARLFDRTIISICEELKVPLPTSEEIEKFPTEFFGDPLLCS